MGLPCTGREGKYSAISRHLPLEDGMREVQRGCTITPAFNSGLQPPTAAANCPFKTKLRPWPHGSWPCPQTPEQRALG